MIVMIIELITRDKLAFSKKQGMEGLVWSVGLWKLPKHPCDRWG